MQTLVQNTLGQRTVTRRLVLGAMGGLFLVLFWSPLIWLIESLGTSEYRLHSALLTGFVLYLCLKMRRAQEAIDRFEFRRGPFALFLSGAAGFLISERRFAIDLLSCVFMGLTVYGFAGFLIASERWRRAAFFVLLFFVCLPLSYHIETFLGFPLRVGSAKLAHGFFTLTHSHVHSTETILMVENKIAHVDLPCSGIKGLWTISLFFLGLSIVERWRLDLAWVFALIFGWISVVLANVIRIIALVLIFNSSLPELMKEALHAPVGLLGFLGAAVATAWVAKRLCTQFANPNATASALGESFDLRAVALIAFILVEAIAFDRLVPPPTREVRLVSDAEPSDRNESLPLSEKERAFFLRQGVMSFAKRKFEGHGLSGTAFLVVSKSWRGHHHPEQCLQAQGHAIETTRTLVIDQDLQVRAVDLKASTHQVLYWFDSREDSTDDYSSRVWSGVLHPERPYVMVSLYLKNGKAGSPAQLKELITDFRRQATALLERESRHER